MADARGQSPAVAGSERRSRPSARASRSRGSPLALNPSLAVRLRAGSPGARARRQRPPPGSAGRLVAALGTSRPPPARCRARSAPGPPPSRAASSNSARAASRVRRPASPSVRSTSACGSPRPSRRRRTASMHAASSARRQSDGTTRRRGRRRQIRRADEREGVLQVAPHRVERPAQLHDRSVAPRHLDHLGCDVEAADGLGQPVVVREHQHLAVRSRALEHAREAVDPGRVHRLHRIVDHDEAERALGQRRPRHEQAQCERVQLALAHHPERSPRDAVDRDVERHAPPRPLARELDAAQLDVALLAQVLPDVAAFSAIGAKRSSRIPAAAFLSHDSAALIAFSSAAPCTAVCARPPATMRPRWRAGRQASSRRASSAPRGVAQAGDRLAQRHARGLDVVGQLREVADRSRPDPRLQRRNQLAEIEAHVGRAPEHVGLQRRQLLPAPACGLGPLVNGVRLARRLAQARPPPSRCLVSPLGRRERACLPHTGQSPSPWCAWYSSARSSSAAASRERAAAVPCADLQRGRCARAARRRRRRPAPRRAARGSRFPAAPRSRPRPSRRTRPRRGPPPRRRGPTPSSRGPPSPAAHADRRRRAAARAAGRAPRSRP